MRIAFYLIVSMMIMLIWILLTALFLPAHASTRAMIYGMGPVMNDSSVPFYSEWKTVMSTAEYKAPERAFTGDIVLLLKQVKARFPAKMYRSNAGWTTPQEFANNGGDCKGFAIAEYYALIEAGVDDARMYLAAYKTDAKKWNGERITHMILVVDDKWVLDNNRDSVGVIQQYTTTHEFMPYKINARGWEAFDFTNMN